MRRRPGGGLQKVASDEEHGCLLDGDTVGHSDTACQLKNVGYSDDVGNIDLLAYGRPVSGLGAEPSEQHIESAPAIVVAQTPPEAKEGHFVGVINELTRLWRLRRSNATMQQIIYGDPEIVCDSY